MNKLSFSLTCIFILFYINLFAQQREAIANVFIKSLELENADMAYALFDAPSKKQFSSKQLSSIWNQIKSQNGTLKSHHFNCETQINDSISITYITCEFEKTTLDVKLVFNDSHKIIGFFIIPVFGCKKYIPPVYNNPKLYIASDITILNDTLKLNASLLMPTESDFQSIYVFIHGSGPNDRDESIGPNKIFKDLAIGLAVNGIASIRYDKRTYTYKNLNKDITIDDEVTSDVHAIIEFVREYKRLQNKKIFILGHSLGGMLCPLVASKDSRIKGLVMLAANARPLETLLLEQTTYLANLDGTVTLVEQTEIDKLQSQIKYLEDSIQYENVTKDKLPLSVPVSYWRSLKSYSQMDIAKSLTVSMYFLKGERDYQVTLKDYNLWKKELYNGQNVLFKSYPKLNHLFLEGEGIPSPKEYYERSNVPYYVINDIVKWTKEIK